jgi:hypothetical protein
MEEATGTHLGKSWDEMSPDSKLKIMREVVSIEAKMLSVSFSQYVFLRFPAAYELTLIQPISYGSIYFASDAVEGAVPAQITNHVAAELKDYMSKTFAVGPSVDRELWNRERSTMEISRGPCMFHRLGLK